MPLSLKHSQTLHSLTQHYWSVRLWEEVAGSLFVVLDIIRSVADGRSGICITSVCICGQRAHARGHSDSVCQRQKGHFCAPVHRQRNWACLSTSLLWISLAVWTHSYCTSSYNCTLHHWQATSEINTLLIYDADIMFISQTTNRN